jgi:transcriptional regulator with XRE-family HTH domain
VSLADAINDEIRRRLTARDMSARQLARRAGVPATLIHRALKGQRSLQLDEVEAIAGAFGVQVLTLLRSAVTHASSSAASPR